MSFWQVVHMRLIQTQEIDKCFYRELILPSLNCGDGDWIPFLTWFTVPEKLIYDPLKVLCLNVCLRCLKPGEYWKEGSRATSLFSSHGNTHLKMPWLGVHLWVEGHYVHRRFHHSVYHDLATSQSIALPCLQAIHTYPFQLCSLRKPRGLGR